MNGQLVRVIIIDPTAIVDLDSCLSTAKLWREHKCGKWRLRTNCRVSISHAYWLLTDIVVALKSYKSILGGARMRGLVRCCRKRYDGVWGSRRKVVSVKMPVEMYEALRELAEKKGYTVSELIRKAIVKYISGLDYEHY